VLSRKGEWVPFTADQDTIVVNIGDMLQRLTNHVYPSTTHRVVNPPGELARQPRYSTPFFLHPNPDFLIDVLPSCVTPDNPLRYPEAITAQGYLEERLREIKLK
jgi:isopenicillin N synthase-like dioxygenase